MNNSDLKDTDLASLTYALYIDLSYLKFVQSYLFIPTRGSKDIERTRKRDEQTETDRQQSLNNMFPQFILFIINLPSKL